MYIRIIFWKNVSKDAFGAIHLLSMTCLIAEMYFSQPMEIRCSSLDQVRRNSTRRNGAWSPRRPIWLRPKRIRPWRRFAAFTGIRCTPIFGVAPRRLKKPRILPRVFSNFCLRETWSPAQTRERQISHVSTYVLSELPGEVAATGMGQEARRPHHLYLDRLVPGRATLQCRFRRALYSQRALRPAMGADGDRAGPCRARSGICREGSKEALRVAAARIDA